MRCRPVAALTGRRPVAARVDGRRRDVAACEVTQDQRRPRDAVSRERDRARVGDRVVRRTRDRRCERGDRDGRRVAVRARDAVQRLARVQRVHAVAQVGRDGPGLRTVDGRGADRGRAVEHGDDRSGLSGAGDLKRLADVPRPGRRRREHRCLQLGEGDRDRRGLKALDAVDHLERVDAVQAEARRDRGRPVAARAHSRRRQLGAADFTQADRSARNPLAAERERARVGRHAGRGARDRRRTRRDRDGHRS